MGNCRNFETTGPHVFPPVTFRIINYMLYVAAAHDTVFSQNSMRPTLMPHAVVTSTATSIAKNP